MPVTNERLASIVKLFAPAPGVTLVVLLPLICWVANTAAWSRKPCAASRAASAPVFAVFAAVANPAAPVALPAAAVAEPEADVAEPAALPSEDRKSTRLNSSHLVHSYAVFCLINLHM